jgi:hypothetical protein
MDFEASLLAWILEVTWGPALEQQWDQQWIRKKHGLGGGKSETLVDMLVQGALNTKDYMSV